MNLPKLPLGSIMPDTAHRNCTGSPATGWIVMLPFSMKTPLLLLCMFLGEFAANTQAAEARPNILFAIADDWGAHASAYGTKWVKTPAFDRVASEGLLFKRAYTPMAKCAPSRACIITGRNTWQLKEAANHICFFPAEFKGWGEALAEHGWFVGHTMKGWGPGIAKDANGKPRLVCHGSLLPVEENVQKPANFT